jgi:hypothetical protein
MGPTSAMDELFGRVAKTTRLSDSQKVRQGDQTSHSLQASFIATQHQLQPSSKLLLIYGFPSHGAL